MNTTPVLFAAKNGAIELRGDIANNAVWATQAQISKIFDIDRTVATKHINKIIADNEVDAKSNVQNMHIANSDKPIKFYSLDIILAVGYRTNSRVAIEFRKWATKTLKQHITKGFTINKKQLQKKYHLFQAALSDIQAIAIIIINSAIPSEGLN